jgi:hypothetical protein
MKFSRDVFNVISAGSPFASQTEGVANELSTRAGQVKLRLESSDPRMLESDAVKRANCIASLENTSTGAALLGAQISLALGRLMQTLSQAAFVNRFKSVLDNVPPSCADHNALVETATSAAVNAATSSALQAVETLDSGITSFLALSMDIPTFNQLLDDTVAALGGLMGTIGSAVNRVNSSTAAVQEASRQAGETFVLAGLLENECALGVISTLASPDLAAAIVAMNAGQNILEF